MLADDLFLKAFAYNIRSRMRAKKMTTRRLAFLCGVTTRAMETYLLNGVQPPLHVAFAIASALKCDIDDLVPKTPLSEKPTRKAHRYVSKMGQVIRAGTCVRSYFYRLSEERGAPMTMDENIQRIAIAAQVIARAKKIRTRAELVREKTRAVQKKASAA